MSKVITGFHSIEEKVRAAQKQQNISSIQIHFAKPGPRVKKIIAQAKDIGIQVFETDEKNLMNMCKILINLCKIIAEL